MSLRSLRKAKMETIKEITIFRKKLREHRLKNQTIGFVPTMGYFHEGHLELMRRARKENDIVVVSVFVNPIQFGPAEDFNRYPRDLKSDFNNASKIGVDYVFTPLANKIYPEGFKTYVEVEEISELLCGHYRPGHFRGVTTVVALLFNIVQPDRAYFGAKDYQQMIIIKRMVKDLHFDLEIVEVPTVREKDGLAMSSRNEYLSKEERQAALILSKSLSVAQNLFTKGEHQIDKIRAEMEKVISTEPKFRLEYLNFCQLDNLKELKIIDRPTLIAMAGYIGKTRLIDNTVIKP